MKALCGMEVSTAVLILHLCTGWCVQFHAPITVHTAKEAPAPNEYEYEAG